MTSLWRAVTCSAARSWPCQAQPRSLCTSPLVHVKKIVCAEEDGNLTIEGRIEPSPREGRVVSAHAGMCTCSLCQLNLNIKHTDVLILSQFLRSDGCMMPRRVTGVCRLQQRRVQQLVAMAQKAGLMPNLAPAWSKRDPKLRYGYRKFNKYFDESTIRDVRPFANLEARGGPPSVQ
ncbi:28S ribosomal protein S18a, mitochondrial-like [Pollicipes pollicipes]|uniref:28S ribosomal protein S18a, mitochondrial-like n=1 Tax=Pollicipes pollicipes TaxID=41117 RepID=UPI001884F93C|nr:28S ribosomal protein S18a, mitochondrial-like [Pollicipes pollicipes]